MNESTSNKCTKADNPAHHSWCQQHRPTCCDKGPIFRGACACDPCRASFAAGQEEQQTEIERLQAENNDLRTAIACAADLMNTWARESNVAECTNPWSGQSLRDLANRLWSYSTREAAQAAEGGE